MAAQRSQDSTRDLLISLCNDDYVRSCLGTYTQHSFAQVIQCIVLRSTLWGRVTRQWHAQRETGLIRSWYRNYIRNVGAYYLREHTRWLRLQTQAGFMDLYELLTRFAWGHAISLQRQGYVLDAVDLAHEALLTCPERLRRYPFDLPLDEWLDRHTRQIAERLVLQEATSNHSQELTDRLPDQSVSADNVTWDEWIDLGRNIEQLSGENRAVLRMWYMGFSLQETSRRLNLTEKAISNRRSRIQRRLSEG